MDISERQNQISEHIQDIEKFVVTSRDYWLNDFSDPLVKDADCARRVRALHAATTHFYGDAEQALKNDVSAVKKYRELSQILFMTATGGEFESVDRANDFNRGIETYDAGFALIHFLRKCRKRQVYPKILRKNV